MSGREVWIREGRGVSGREVWERERERRGVSGREVWERERRGVSGREVWKGGGFQKEGLSRGNAKCWVTRGGKEEAWKRRGWLKEM